MKDLVRGREGVERKETQQGEREGEGDAEGVSEY